MRAFVALTLPTAARAAIRAAAAQLQGRGDVRWTPAEQLHVTLQFFGDVDAAQADRLIVSLRQLRWRAPLLRLSGTGQFPARGAPRVLWVGLGGDVAAVTELAAAIGAMASELGRAPELRPFGPHVTIGRCRSARGAALLAGSLRSLAASVDGPEFPANDLVLYRSDVGDDGATYSELVRVHAPGRAQIT